MTSPLHIPRVRQRKPSKLPGLKRTPIEKANIALAVVYILAVVVVGLDVFIWRP